MKLSFSKKKVLKWQNDQEKVFFSSSGIVGVDVFFSCLNFQSKLLPGCLEFPINVHKLCSNSKQQKDTTYEVWFEILWRRRSFFWMYRGFLDCKATFLEKKNILKYKTLVISANYILAEKLLSAFVLENKSNTFQKEPHVTDIFADLLSFPGLFYSLFFLY